jgi:hypothetical protein
MTSSVSCFSHNMKRYHQTSGCRCRIHCSAELKEERCIHFDEYPTFPSMNTFQNREFDLVQTSDQRPRILKKAFWVLISVPVSAQGCGGYSWPYSPHCGRRCAQSFAGRLVSQTGEDLFNESGSIGFRFFQQCRCWHLQWHTARIAAGVR